MAYSIRHHTRFAYHLPGKRSRYGLAVAAAAVFGLLALQVIGAATYTADSQAETGVINGNASRTAPAGASDGQAVSFGAAVLAAPANVKAITGGNNIALLWDMPAGKVKHVEVFRNDVKVATVTPNSGVIRAERLGTRYIDRAVSRGTTYHYKVRAVNQSDLPSAFSAAASATHPTSTTPVPTVTIDASQAPDLTDYLNNYAKPELETWYPKIADAIAFPAYTPINSMRLYMDPANTGTAFARHSQRLISVNPAWLRNNALDGGGMFIHEATHILQAYNGDMSGWITEGIADWTRDWFTRERAHVPGPGANILNGHSEGALALQWGEVKYSPGLVRAVNIAMHNGTYTASTISSRTGGRTGEQLYAEAKQQHYGATGTLRGIAGKCMDILNSDPAFGAKVQLFGCNNTNAQRWTIVYRDAGLHGSTRSIMHLANSAIIADGRCLDVVSSGTASGTRVHSWHCNFGNAQTWVRGANDSLVNPNSGKCLATTGGGSENGNQLIIADCDGSAGQRWVLPG